VRIAIEEVVPAIPAFDLCRQVECREMFNLRRLKALSVRTHE